MLQHSNGIDHVVILVRDLDAARDRYAGLGFTLSPRGFHSEKMGTANHTIMLRDDYFEVLGVIADTPQNQRWRDAVAVREGLTGIAMKTDSAARLAAELRGRGIQAGDALDFERPVGLPGGETGVARFAVTELPNEATPGASFFACEQKTRDTVWLPGLTSHANTATGLAGITIQVPDMDAATAAYGRLFGDSAVGAHAGGAVVRTGTITLQLVSGEPRVLGFAIKVADLAAAERCLKAAGARFAAGDGRLMVEPDDACGVALQFVG